MIYERVECGQTEIAADSTWTLVNVLANDITAHFCFCLAIKDEMCVFVLGPRITGVDP